MDIIKSIIEKINELEAEFKESKALILSEGDLKCHLFRKLYSLFNHNENTMDSHFTGSPLHTEIKFFDESDKLTLIPDITILDSSDLSIIHSLKYRITSSGIKYKRTSSKEFEFGGDTIIIELKFCKNKSGINKRSVKSYENDLEKIKRLQKIVNTRSSGENKVFGLFVVFNKTDKKSLEFQNFLEKNPDTENLKIIYKTASLDLSIANRGNINF